MHLYFSILQLMLNIRTQLNLILLKQQNNGRTSQFKMTFFHSAKNTEVLSWVANAADHQCADFC